MKSIDQWIAIAKNAAAMSKDPRTKVGAVIVDEDERIVSTGRNGMVAKANEKELWRDKHPFVIHAEMNAALFARRDLRGCRVYVTHSPCINCLKHLLQMGVRVMYYDVLYDKFTEKDKEDITTLLNSMNCHVENYRNGLKMQEELE